MMRENERTNEIYWHLSSCRWERRTERERMREAEKDKIFIRWQFDVFQHLSFQSKKQGWVSDFSLLRRNPSNRCTFDFHRRRSSRGTKWMRHSVGSLSFSPALLLLLCSPVRFHFAFVRSFVWISSRTDWRIMRVRPHLYEIRHEYVPLHLDSVSHVDQRDNDDDDAAAVEQTDMLIKSKHHNSPSADDDNQDSKRENQFTRHVV